MGVNQLYDNARERLLKAQLNWPAITPIMLAYTGDPTTSFIPTHLTQANLGTPYAVSQVMTSPIVMTGGYASSDAANFAAIPVGTAVTFFVLAEDNATPASRKFLAFLGDLNNLPLIPNGGGYLVKPDWSFTRGWFRA